MHKNPYLCCLFMSYNRSSDQSISPSVILQAHMHYTWGHLGPTCDRHAPSWSVPPARTPPKQDLVIQIPLAQCLATTNESGPVVSRGRNHEVMNNVVKVVCYAKWLHDLFYYVLDKSLISSMENGPKGTGTVACYERFLYLQGLSMPKFFKLLKGSVFKGRGKDIHSPPWSTCN